MIYSNRVNLTKLYCLIIPVLPIMGMYGFSELPFLTFSDYLLIICYILWGIYALNKKKTQCRGIFLPLVVYLLLHPMILASYAASDIDWVDAIGTSWRLAFYVFPLCILSPYHLDKHLLIKSFRFIGLTSSVYAIAQFCFGTFLSISLSPYLPFLPILREGIEKQQLGWIDYGWMVRARAWFSEPSTLAIFLILAAFIELFILNSQNKKKFLVCYFLGIFISHSSTGTVGLLFLLMSYAYIYVKRKKSKIPIRVMLGVCLIMPIVILFLIRSGYVAQFISHAFVDGAGLSQQSHFSSITGVFQKDFNLFEILFGNGMQETVEGYLPGWIRTFYSLGIVGIILYSYAFILSMRQNSSARMVLVMLFSFLNIGTEIMLGVYLLLYFSVLEISECEGESYGYNKIDKSISGNIYS